MPCTVRVYFLPEGGMLRLRRSLRYGLATFLLVLPLAGCSRQPAVPASPQASSPRPSIAFMTDFGTANDAVAICRAVIYGIAPDVRITDITHQVTPFSIEEASRFLYGVTPYYPEGTDGLESAREITNQHWMIQAPLSSTFHGRDIFSPAAAHLAAGWEFDLVGPPVQQLVRLTPKTSVTSAKGVEGDVIGLDDPYGSLITDIPGEDFKQLGYNLGDKVFVQMNKRAVLLPYAKTFMDVPVGESLLYIDSRGRVGIAINQGSYARKFNITPPEIIFIPRKGVPIRIR